MSPTTYHFLKIIVFLIAMVFIWSTRNARLKANARARAPKLLGFIKSMYAMPHERRSVSPREFPYLDLAWYDRVRDFLVRQGFTFLGDYQDITANRALRRSMCPTFIRALISSDGSTMTEVFDGRWRFWYRCFVLLGGGRRLIRARSFELATEFGDGTFVCTTNNPLAHTFRIYPMIQRNICLPSAPYESVLQIHNETLRQRLEADPQLRPIRIQSLEEVYQSCERMRKAQLAYLQTAGFVAREQIAAVATKSQQKAALYIAEEIERIQKNESPEK